MGEILGETIVYFLLNFIGGTVRWLIGNMWHFIFNTPKHTFKAYVYGPNQSNPYDSAHGCINLVIAFGLIFGIIAVFI